MMDHHLEKAPPNLRSSSHNPGAKSQVMTQESEIGSMKNGKNILTE